MAIEEGRGLGGRLSSDQEETHGNSDLRVSTPNRPLLFEPDYERRTIETVRRFLDDDKHCREADYSIRWVKTASGPMPLLVLAFHLSQTIHQPALGIGLVAVQKGTLLEVLPGKTILEGERLRNHVLRSVDDYLTKHGVRLPETIQL